jgi:hypothetical protein
LIADGRAVVARVAIAVVVRVLLATVRSLRTVVERVHDVVVGRVEHEVDIGNDCIGPGVHEALSERGHHRARVE